MISPVHLHFPPSLAHFLYSEVVAAPTPAADATSSFSDSAAAATSSTASSAVVFALPLFFAATAAHLVTCFLTASN